MNTTHEFWTVTEVATHLRVSRQAVAEWCRTGELKALRAGKAWRIENADLMAYLNRGQRKEDHPAREV